MRRLKYILILLLFVSYSSFAQRYMSTSSEVDFYSEAPVEDIEAKNVKGKSILDLGTNDIVFSIPISSFVFDKSLMQEHFNEKYMESDKYPKAIFKGKIFGFDMSKSGIQKVRSEGELTIHGVTKKIDQTGEMSAQDGKITLNHAFKIAIKDYKIEIPKLLWQNIAEVIDVKVAFEYKLYEK